MILTLQEAQTVNPAITQGELDAYEAAVRQLTNNSFQATDARGVGLTVTGADVTFDDDNLTEFAREGDTIEISGTTVDDGLYTVTAADAGTLTLDRNPRETGKQAEAYATLVVYPADVIEGVKRLIDYDKDLGGKTGIKSETISRMSVTYYDTNGSETVSGYPAHLMSFLRKYEKIRWG